MFHGNGIGIAALQQLLTEGVRLWEEKYRDKVYALDTLTDRGDSKLFINNGWQLIGKTKGYSSDPSKIFSKSSGDKYGEYIKNNVGLTNNSIRWFVWVKIVDPQVLVSIERQWRGFTKR